MPITVQSMQGYSALFFAGYLVPHLGNTFAAVFGPGPYDAVQKVLRTVYTHPVVEAVILGSAVVHVAAGILHARSRTYNLTGESKVNVYTGYFITTFIASHVYFTRAFVYLGFGGVALSLQKAPVIFFPYYIAFGAAGAVHVLIGLPKAFAYSGIRTPRMPKKAVKAAVVGVTLGVLALGGRFFKNKDSSSHPYAEHLYAHVPKFFITGYFFFSINEHHPKHVIFLC